MEEQNYNGVSDLFNIDHSRLSNTSLDIGSTYGFTGDNNKHIELNYPEDLKDQTAYTAFFISVRKSDEITKLSLGLGSTDENLKRIGKTSYGERLSDIANKTVGLIGGMSDIQNNYLGKNYGTVQQRGCIVLPTPKIGTKYATDWSADGSILAQQLNTISQELSNNEGFLNKLGGVIGGVTKRALANWVLKKSVVGKVAGVVPNPQKDQYFKDVNFRSFDFSWVFSPRSKQEAKNIFNIIKQFKYHMLPRETDDGIMWIYPSEFDIVHVWNGKPNPYLPRHTASVLTNVSVDYGDNGIQFMSNGFPAIINLSLSFTELAVVTKKDIEEGY